MLAHASLCNRTNSPLGTSQLFTIAQLHQHLQLLETEQLLRPIPTLLLLLRMLNNCVRACSEQVEELARAVEVDVCLDVLEILLQNEDVELHPTAAMRVHRFDHARVADKEGVDEETEAGADEGDFFFAEEIGNCLVIGDKIGVETENSGIWVINHLLEEIWS